MGKESTKTIENVAEMLPEPGAARMSTLAELGASIKQKGAANTPPGLYHRDGRPEVSEIESLISEVTIPGQQLNVVTGAGQAAVKAAVEISLSIAGRDLAGKRAPLLAHGEEGYTQTPILLEHLRYMGISTTTFDSGRATAIDKLIDEKRPDVLFAETVTNTPSMSVLDITWLLEKTRSMGEGAPRLVLDNTLTKKTGIDFDELLLPSDQVLVVESITKAELHNGNTGVGGNIYSKNEELMDRVRKYRATCGFVITTAACEAIIETLGATLPGFHDRNKALFASTNKIARALDRAKKHLGNEADFDISFPILPNHANYEYVRDNMPKPHAQKRVSPVAFITPTLWRDGAARSLLDRISSHPKMQEQLREGQIYFGQSFGFPEATYLFHDRASYVRFAGGHSIDSDALADALEEAAADK